jgi:hypothetical protein
MSHTNDYDRLFAEKMDKEFRELREQKVAFSRRPVLEEAEDGAIERFIRACIPALIGLGIAVLLVMFA